MTRTYRFGSFELDLHNRDLRKGGLRVSLQQKPFQLLALLLETPGELVTRQQLADRLWPGMHVSFDRSLNTAVNTLRQKLGDSPQAPRFIETRPGIGYRFVAPIEAADQPVHPANGARARNAAAYQDCLKGRFFCNRMTEDDLHKGIASYEAAIAEDPGCALAHAGLADAYCLFAVLGLSASGTACTRAREYAAAALRLDSQLAEAHVAYAAVRKLFEWDWAGSEAGYRRALALKPDLADGHCGRACLLAATGRHEDASREIGKAHELDPLSIVINMQMAWTFYMARDFQSAMEQSWKTLALEPKFVGAQHTLGLAYEHLDLQEEALVELENACACSDRHPTALAALGHAHAAAGRERNAQDCLLELQQIARHRYVSSYCRGLIYAGLGDANQALAALERARDERDVSLIWIKAEPRFDGLRQDRRFQNLLTGIHRS